MGQLMKMPRSNKESKLNVKRLLIAVSAVIIMAAFYYWYSQSNLVGLSNYLFSSAYQSTIQQPISFINANLSNSTSIVSFGSEHGNATSLMEEYIYENNTLINCEYGPNYSQGQLCTLKSLNNGTTLLADAVNPNLAKGGKFIMSVYMHKRLVSRCIAIGYGGNFFIRGITNSTNATIEVPDTTNANVCAYYISFINGTFYGGGLNWPSQQSGQYTVITWQNKSG